MYHDSQAPILGRRYRIPTNSSEAQCETQPTAHREDLDTSRTCQKCGKRKPESRLANHDIHKKHSRIDHDNEERKENISGSGCRQPPVIFNGIHSTANHTIPAQNSHSSCIQTENQYPTFSGLQKSSSGEFTDCEAVARKIDTVFSRLLPQSRHYKHSHYDGYGNHDRQARDRENARQKSSSRSPVRFHENNPILTPKTMSCDPPISGKQLPQKITEFPSCKLNQLPTGEQIYPLQSPLEGAKLQPKDYSEMGRRIWQTLFEATDAQFTNNTAPSSTLANQSNTPLSPDEPTPQNYDQEKEGNKPYNPIRLRGSAIPRHVRWQPVQPPARCGSRPASAYQIVDGEQCTTDGKFIRMKFGKKVKMIQIPQREVETGKDEVQVLVRHGKSVIWRNYKTFNH